MRLNIQDQVEFEELVTELEEKTEETQQLREEFDDAQTAEMEAWEELEAYCVQNNTDAEAEGYPKPVMKKVH